jgi:hypothetical protein
MLVLTYFFCGAKSIEWYLMTFVQTDSVIWRLFKISCSVSQQGSDTKGFKQCGKDTQIPYRNFSYLDPSGHLVVSYIFQMFVHV